MGFLLHGLSVKEVHMEKLAVKIGKRLLTVNKDDIVYLEQSGRKLTINTDMGEFCVYGNLDEYEKRLGDGFFRCHSFCIVNLNKIASIEGFQIDFVGGLKVYLGKSNIQKLKKTIVSYMD